MRTVTKPGTATLQSDDTVAIIAVAAHGVQAGIMHKSWTFAKGCIYDPKQQHACVYLSKPCHKLMGLYPVHSVPQTHGTVPSASLSGTCPAQLYKGWHVALTGVPEDPVGG